MNPPLYWPRPLPHALKGLAELALNLHWSWNHSSDALWQAIDPELWEASQNPWVMLTSVSLRRFEELATDRRFCTELAEQLKALRGYVAEPSWYRRAYEIAPLDSIAFFSMEFGLSEALPIYSGGLGILAGDYLKAASDLGVPVAGIGLLYQQGNFRQALDASCHQLEFSPANDPALLPILPLRNDDGDWLRVAVELPGRTLKLRSWQAQVGRVHLYLLDSNDPENLPGDRGITGRLYGSGIENRLQQEVALGIGGWRLLRALKIKPSICHFNESHAIFAALERARDFMNETGIAFSPALCCTRPGNIFTCHTTVPAGFHRFSPSLMARYFRGYASQLGIPLPDLLALGKLHPETESEPFHLTYLAVRTCGRTHAISRSHERISRGLFEPLFLRWPAQEVPVEHVEVGIHVPSWESPAADDLWTIASGKNRWACEPEQLHADLCQSSLESLWALRNLERRALLESMQRKLARQAAAHGLDLSCGRLDPNVFTMAVAHPFTSYRRPHLLLFDPERLMRILTHPERPVQLIVTGKAHPKDDEGKKMVRAWALYMRRPDIQGRMIFIEDCDLALTCELVQGVDLWINVPRQSTEASGTSGMKVLANGGLNLSIHDGWWAEAYAPELGWSIGDGQTGTHDPGWDAVESAQLFNLLENEVIPAFYARDEHGMPAGWVRRIRESMARLTPRYSTHRMLRQYLERCYLPCVLMTRRRSEHQGAIGEDIHRWSQMIAKAWPGIRFGNLQIQTMDDSYDFHVEAYFGELPPDMVRIELYAEALHGGAAVRQVMVRGEGAPDSSGAYSYQAKVPANRPARDYTPRIIPWHPEALIPLEETHSLWLR